MNELPLRHLFFHLDGSTSGPKSYNGPIGKVLENWEELRVIKFQKIEGDVLPDMTDDLSTDQKYLHRIVTAIISGTFPDDLRHKSLGKLSHARWLTRANRLFTSLRRYLKPDISFEDLKCIVDTVIQRNGYFAHSENLLLAMITDERKHIRELAARRILKARSSAVQTPRLFDNCIEGEIAIAVENEPGIETASRLKSRAGFRADRNRKRQWNSDRVTEENKVILEVSGKSYGSNDVVEKVCDKLDERNRATEEVGERSDERNNKAKEGNAIWDVRKNIEKKENYKINDNVFI
ncbi:hypothetical protein EVAR_84953_1 [Eumeta japonica]|uniref:Uncharacterized protein n=1 Tax=Eumeta variegata TaxID=151549 RepID=A0A4C1VGD5_EUMVA|nr:hypothetical protein EVAR_84953_1 [Eumeta japonica]